MNAAALAVVAAWAAWALVAAPLAASDPIIYTPESEEDANKYTLPLGFLFGAGTSSYQVEGAWNVSGKGVNVFDKRFNIDGKNPDPLHNGNIAADSYHRLDEDIEVIKKLKLQIYRFSISWARLLPDGDATKPNPDGIRYYNDVINKLRAVNVEPMITLYHFDHPQILHDQYDSWLGTGMIDKFVEYADFAFKSFGDRVTYWTTFNEPNIYCPDVYEGNMAPGNGSGDIRAHWYTCIHNQLLAHGKAYRLYQKRYRATQTGKIGLTCLASGFRPNNSSFIGDIQETDSSYARDLGHCAAPLLFGNYPDIVIKGADTLSKEDGLASSRLPKFTEEEKKMLTDSVDFLGLNVYGGHIVSKEDMKSQRGVVGLNNGRRRVRGNIFPGGKYPGEAFEPWALEAVLGYVVDHYKNIPVIFTETGCEDRNGIHDQFRAGYHSAYMRSMLNAVSERGANVFAMTVWTLIDNFEWSRGYTPKMGMVHVDYTSPNRTRTLKDSSDFFVKLMTERRVPLVWLPERPSDDSDPQPTDSTVPEPSDTTDPKPTSQPTSGVSRSASSSRHFFFVGVAFLLIKLVL